MKQAIFFEAIEETQSSIIDEISLVSYILIYSKQEQYVFYAYFINLYIKFSRYDNIWCGIFLLDVNNYNSLEKSDSYNSRDWIW